MRNIVKRIVALALLTTMLIPVNNCYARENSNANDIFRINSNEQVDISSLKKNGMVRTTKIKHTSTNETAVTTNQYYIDNPNDRNEIYDELTNELSDMGEMQATGNNNTYQSKLDSTCSYEMHMTTYWSTYSSGGKDYAKVTSVSGGYTERDWTVSVVSQYVSIGQCKNTISSTISKTPSPSTSSWSYSTNFDYVDITGTNVSFCNCGGAYYDLEIKRNAGSWTTELYNTCWDTGNVSLADFLGR